MSEDTLKTDFGLYFDVNNKVKFLDPEVLSNSLELKDGCKEFLGKFEDFNKVIAAYITSVSSIAAEVESAKLKALGQQNLLKSTARERSVATLQLHDLIQEKKRLKSRQDEMLEALKKEEAYQESFIKRFKDQ